MFEQRPFDIPDGQPTHNDFHHFHPFLHSLPFELARYMAATAFAPIAPKQSMDRTPIGKKSPKPSRGERGV
jgi:hypothetical protein